MSIVRLKDRLIPLVSFIRRPRQGGYSVILIVAFCLSMILGRVQLPVDFASVDITYRRKSWRYIIPSTFKRVSTTFVQIVLLTGGDAFTLSDGRLEKVLQALRAIPHVETIRLSTRLPVTLPQRVTPELCEMLSRYGLMGGQGALWVVTHFNHPIEVTPEAAKACLMLISHGMPILNQSVLLAGVNDDRHIIMRLNQELVRIGVKPYYLFHCKSVDGAIHFRTPLKTGLDIIEYLNGRTSGMALPYYVISLPDGKGKVRLVTSAQVHETDTPGVWRVTSWEGDDDLYDER